MALQIESIDSGSNYQFGDKLEVPNVPRSLFDKSHTIITTIENAGKIQVLNWLHTLPNEDDDISVDSLLRVMPQTVPLYSKQRQYVYGFWNSLSNLWSNFQVFATKGYSGTVIKYIPVYNDTNLAADTDGLGIQPGSLGDQLGLPIGMTRTQLVGAKIICLDFMMLLRLWRDYFCNKNYYMNDRILLPDDDSRFRLNDNGILMSALDEGYTFKIDLFSKAKGITRVNTAGSESITFHNFYHEYPKDRFTSAFPSTQRGNEETLPINIGINESTKPLFITKPSGSSLGYTTAMSPTKHGSPSIHDGTTLIKYEDNNWTEETSTNINKINNDFNSWLISHPISSITVNDLRKAFINQRIMEKMAKTDGSFGEFGLTLFGVKPKSANDYRATYIGGTYKDITFTEVLQTSPTGTGDDKVPLGAYAGHGITGQNNNYLGHLRSDDYGIVMFLTCIMPDIYYCQGIEKKHSLSIQEDLITPERCKLGMIPILNKEVYYQGNNGTSSGQDEYLWAYQDYADEYRYVENKISGKIADPNNKSFFPFTQCRMFDSLPNWSKEFATADNVRKDYLASTTEDAYSCMFHFNLRSVLPIPYRAEPATLGI